MQDKHKQTTSLSIQLGKPNAFFARQFKSSSPLRTLFRYGFLLIFGLSLFVISGCASNKDFIGSGGLSHYQNTFDRTKTTKQLKAAVKTDTPDALIYYNLTHPRLEMDKKLAKKFAKYEEPMMEELEDAIGNNWPVSDLLAKIYLQCHPKSDYALANQDMLRQEASKEDGYWLHRVPCPPSDDLEIVDEYAEKWIFLQQYLRKYPDGYYATFLEGELARLFSSAVIQQENGCFVGQSIGVSEELVHIILISWYEFSDLKQQTKLNVAEEIKALFINRVELDLDDLHQDGLVDELEFKGFPWPKYSTTPKIDKVLTGNPDSEIESTDNPLTEADEIGFDNTNEEIQFPEEDDITAIQIDNSDLNAEPAVEATEDVEDSFNNEEDFTSTMDDNTETNTPTIVDGSTNNTPTEHAEAGNVTENTNESDWLTLDEETEANTSKVENDLEETTETGIIIPNENGEIEVEDWVSKTFPEYNSEATKKANTEEDKTTEIAATNSSNASANSNPSSIRSNSENSSNNATLNSKTNQETATADNDGTIYIPEEKSSEYTDEIEDSEENTVITDAEEVEESSSIADNNTTISDGNNTVDTYTPGSDSGFSFPTFSMTWFIPLALLFLIISILVYFRHVIFNKETWS